MMQITIDSYRFVYFCITYITVYSFLSNCNPAFSIKIGATCLEVPFGHMTTGLVGPSASDRRNSFSIIAKIMPVDVSSTLRTLLLLIVLLDPSAAL